jgi:hypothetical protein
MTWVIYQYVLCLWSRGSVNKYCQTIQAFDTSSQDWRWCIGLILPSKKLQAFNVRLMSEKMFMRREWSKYCKSQLPWYWIFSHTNCIFSTNCESSSPLSFRIWSRALDVPSQPGRFLSTYLWVSKPLTLPNSWSSVFVYPRFWWSVTFYLWFAQCWMQQQVLVKLLS